jgi:hypothetical protein
VTNTAELFDPSSGIFTLLPNTMSSPRWVHTATLLHNGKILITGGASSSGGGFLNTAEVFDPASGTFTSLSPNTMQSARYFHSATLLPSGRVLITGGSTGSAVTSSTELFDPVTGTFTTASPMTVPREHHTATLLPSGRVLIAGGDTGFVATNTAEVFDPTSGTFTAVSGTMTAVRVGPTALLLLNGKVLLTGGAAASSGVGISNTAELFDEGVGFSDARRPVILTAPNTSSQGASFSLTGTGFRGDSEASSGSFDSSATNYPIVQLQRIDNEQIFFVLSDAALNWSDTQFTSELLGATSPLPSGSYRVTVFTNAIPSLSKVINITGPPLQLVSAGSRKTHGSSGTFDVDLPFSFGLPVPPPGIECRAGGGTGGDHTLVFTFNNIPVSGSATVVSGAGSVAGSPIFSGHEMQVNLTGVTNAQQIGVILNVTDNSGQSFSNPEGIPVSMAVLIGDVNGNGVVSNTDVASVKAQVAAPIDSSNFRVDVNANGVISNTDVSTTKAQVGATLP